ncbi:MAG: hypothetical protein ACLRZQ_04605 [Akkermansia muciniphila]
MAFLGLGGLLARRRRH